MKKTPMPFVYLKTRSVFHGQPKLNINSGKNSMLMANEIRYHQIKNNFTSHFIKVLTGLHKNLTHQKFQQKTKDIKI